MTWDPDPTVTIAGTDYTGATLETVRITRGRADVYSEPRAGYLFAELIDTDGTGLNVDVLDTVTVTLDDSTGSPVDLFTGTVSDWAANLYDAGTESGTAKSIVTIIAVGPLATLNRRNVAADGLPAAKDGTRVAALVAAGLAASWQETNGTWTTVGTATSSWNTIDTGYDPTYIDTPGVYDIAALDATDAGHNPLGQAQLTAFSARGILWDTADGYVAYADADRRPTSAEAGYLDLPETVILANGLTSSSSFTDIVNKVAVAYAGGAVIRQSAESILTYTTLGATFTTNLANESNAIAWGDEYLNDHDGPTIQLGTVRLRLDGITDDALRDDLLSLDVNDPVALEDLPGTLGAVSLPTFVEGLDWRINRATIGLQLNLSDAELSIGAMRWGLVPQTYAWDDAPATLTWADARRL